MVQLCSASVRARREDVTPHEEYETLGSTQRTRQAAYQQLFDQALESDLVAEIKQAQQTGFVLGTVKFRQQFAALTGYPQFHKKRGPKPPE